MNIPFLPHSLFCEQEGIANAGVKYILASQSRLKNSSCFCFHCHTLVRKPITIYITFSVSVTHKAVSQVSRQNLRRSNSFIVVTEDPVNTSDWVVSSAARHQKLELNQNGSGCSS